VLTPLLLIWFCGYRAAHPPPSAHFFCLKGPASQHRGISPALPSLSFSETFSPPPSSPRSPLANRGIPVFFSKPVWGPLDALSNFSFLIAGYLSPPLGQSAFAFFSPLNRDGGGCATPFPPSQDGPFSPQTSSSLLFFSDLSCRHRLYTLLIGSSFLTVQEQIPPGYLNLSLPGRGFGVSRPPLPMEMTVKHQGGRMKKQELYLPST